MRLTCAVFLLVLVSAPLAKVPTTALSDLVDQSDAIVVGQVVDLKRGVISRQYGVASNLALVKVTSCLKGSSRADVTVRFHPSLSEQPSLVLGASYLMFLRSSPDGLEAVLGPLGSLEIRDGEVRTGEIWDEPKRQPLHELVRRIGAPGCN